MSATAAKSGGARWVAVVVVGLCGLLSVQALGCLPAAASSSSTPTLSCPPDCGRVAAGDPLLVPFVAVNPGPGWLALPADRVASYAASLKHNLARSSGRRLLANVAAAKWTWLNGRFELLVVLVSSPSLRSLGLLRPGQDAGDLCASSHGVPSTQLVTIKGVPGSVSGLCRFAANASFKGATVSAFTRGNVAALIEISSSSDRAIDPRTAAIAVDQQYLALPAAGVLVSTGGFDLALLVMWLLIVAAIALGVAAFRRARGGWRIVVGDAASAIRRRYLALGVGLLGIVGAMAFSMLDSSLLHGVGQWYESGYNDFWRSWSTAADVTRAGGLGHVFSLDTALETTPTWLIVLSPLARLASGLSFPDPSSVLYPSAYWVAGPAFLAAMLLPLCAADHWMRERWQLATLRRSVVLASVAIVLPPAALSGHPEDLIALGAAMYALLAAVEGRAHATGWWLGVALAFQFLAFLILPIALVLLGRTRWRSALGPVLGVPLAMLMVPLVVAPSSTVHQLLHQKVYFDLGFITPSWRLGSAAGALVRGLEALAAIPAALVVLRLRTRARPDSSVAPIALWILGALFAFRVLEPELVPYFLAPALALFCVSAARRPWWRLLTACAGAVWLTWWLHDPVQERWWAWLFLIAQLVVLAGLALPPRQREATGKAAAKTERGPRQAGARERVPVRATR